MKELAVYWNCNDEGKPRTYHHTYLFNCLCLFSLNNNFHFISLTELFIPSPPINLFYGLREALAQVVNEGLPNLWKRHEDNSQRLYAGLTSMGMEFFVEKPELRLPTVTTVKIPHGISDWKHVVQYAMDK
jgi:aspartate aminotransferase-like enzyme